jgi:hypothetical protein
MLSIYDLSNHHTLITSQGIQGQKEYKIVVHHLAIRLKLTSMKMISILIQLMMSGKNGISRLDREIEV